MKKLTNLWNLMWGKHNFKKTLGFHLFQLVFLALMLFTNGAMDEWFFLYGGDSIFEYYPAYLPIFLIVVFWVGNYVSFNKRGRI